MSEVVVHGKNYEIDDKVREELDNYLQVGNNGDFYELMNFFTDEDVATFIENLTNRLKKPRFIRTIKRSY